MQANYISNKTDYSNLIYILSNEQSNNTNANININLKGGDKNFCNLPKKSKLYFGSGGSDGIIAITPNGNVYKFFPIFVRPNEPNEIVSMTREEIRYEIAIIRELTIKVTKTKLSPHIIEYIDDYVCTKEPKNIFKNCPSYTEYY